MVIRDFSDSYSPNKNSNELLIGPSTQERFLAVVFDGIFFAPIFSIIFFKFIKKLNITQVVAPQSALMSWYFLTTIFLFLISFVFYQAISLYLKGTTLGKNFFKIKVISENSSQLSWNQSFLRSVVWSLECIFLGVSFLEVIAHDKQKTIHDKLAETRVVSLKEKHNTVLSFKIEKAFIGMIYLTTFFLFTFMSVQFFVSKINKGESHLVATMTAQNPCENEIKNVSTESLLVDWIFNPERAACLEKKISYDFQFKNPSPMTLVAAFVTKSYDDEKRAEYKKLICKSDTEACIWASQYDNYLKTKQLADIVLPKSYFYNFWYAKVSSESKKYELSNLTLKKIELNEAHLNYFLELKLQNSIGLGDKPAIDSTLEVLSKILSPEEYTTIKKWVPVSSDSSIRTPASVGK